MPPIVGVPCLAMWCSGPWSSLPRIGWPSPRPRNAAINILVMTSDNTPAVTPAIITAITTDAPGGHERRSDRRSRRPRHRWSGSSRGPCRRRRRCRRYRRRRGRGRWRPPDRARRRPSADRRRRTSGEHGVDDGDRVLGSRVVRCHDDVIGEPGRRRRPSAAASPCRGRRRSRTRRCTRPSAIRRARVDHLLQAVRRVGVVDDHRRPAAGRPARARTGQAPRSTAARPAAMASTPIAEHVRRGGGGERVHHVERDRRAGRASAGPAT